MKKIPVLGTQTLNSVSNLKRLIESIDYPVEVLSIIVNNENFDILLEVKNFCDNLNNKNIDKIDISFHPTNLGCPPSWNYHFKQYPYAKYFMKADDDIQFLPGDLEKFVNVLENGGDMVFYGDKTKYACFGISKHTLKTVGLFDENHWPANYEDDDYQIRLRLCNIKESYLGMSITHTGSGTSRNLKEPIVEHNKLSQYLIQTEEYFYKKWGQNREFLYPFNDATNKITNVDYNFNYRENKIFRCDYTK
jgi:hypothetical protein